MAELYKTVPYISDLPVIEFDLIDCIKIDPNTPPLILKNQRPSLDFKLPI